MLQKNLEIGIIGLGKFGLQMAQTLRHLDQTVVGIDSNNAHVEVAGQYLDTVYKGDASQLATLRALRVHELDCVMVCVGANMEHSLTITLNLQELQVPNIWVKAMNVEHRKILHRLGIEHVILPEHDAAIMAAHRLTNPGILELIPKYGGLAVQELTVDAWAGKSLMELNLTNDYEVMVVGIRPHGSDEYHFVPSARDALHKDDTLIVIGRLANVKKLRP